VLILVLSYSLIFLSLPTEIIKELSFVMVKQKNVIFNCLTITNDNSLIISVGNDKKIRE
jgi:hypothetical protein